MSNVKAIPDGYHTVTAYLMVKDASAAIEFYKKAFGAEEIMRLPSPDGKSIAHAEIRIGDSPVMLGDETPMEPSWVSPPSLKGTTVGMMLYVEDVDKSFQRAVDAGATPVMPVTDMFWGDRYGKVTDPFGHHWAIATHKEDLTPDEIAKGAQEFFAKMGACSQ